MTDQETIDRLSRRLSILAKKDSVEFDFHGTAGEATTILFQKGQLKNCSQSESRHLNLRVLRDAKAGFSYTKEFSEKSLEESYREALHSLNLSDKEEAGDLAGANERYRRPLERTSPAESQDIPLEEKIRSAREMDAACFEFKNPGNKKARAEPVYSFVSEARAVRFFADSRGGGAICPLNSTFAGCCSLAVQEESRSEGYGEDRKPSFKDIDFRRLGEEAADEALKKLNHSVPETGKRPVVFQPDAAADLLQRAAQLLSGKTVFDGVSLFKNCFGKKVFSDVLSLYDDPFADWTFGAVFFDGEGFAKEKTVLVENGFLKNYLTSSFFAKALKTPHTKKARWIGSKPNLAADFLFAPQGDSSFEELASALPGTAVIDRLKGWAGYNPVSGDFSILSEGFLRENGEMRPIGRFTVSGNIKDLFLNILKTGNDSRVVKAGSVKTPSFLAPDLMIAGK